MPESKSSPLDEQGACGYCDPKEDRFHFQGEANLKDLEALIERAKSRSKNARFDCVVAWSGGRDSTHLVHELVVRHKLRCAAVFGITPFTPPEIVDNVRRIARELGVELFEVGSGGNHLEIAKFCLERYAIKPDPILINLACASCKYVNKEIFRVAKRLGAKTVIYGGNRYEYLPKGPASVEISGKDRYSFVSMLLDNLLRIPKGFGILFRNLRLLRHLKTFVDASILYVNQYSIYLRLRHPSIERIDYYHYAEWNLTDVETTLQTLGWRLPEGCTSTWRADCTFEAVKNTAFRQKLGFTYSQAMYSNLIRSEKISRTEAIDRLSRESISESRLATALESCGLKPDHFGPPERKTVTEKIEV